MADFYFDWNTIYLLAKRKNFTTLGNNNEINVNLKYNTKPVSLLCIKTFFERSWYSINHMTIFFSLDFLYNENKTFILSIKQLMC